LLAREILQRVREIQVRTGRQVADVLAGEYVSVFKGRGIEFDEVRPYVPGDDVRSIDWNVTARTGEPFVKRYVEERQLTLMLMADVSASQDFGSGPRSKREVTAELCALLAFSASRNDDKVGLTLFHGEIEQYIPPRKGQKHALRVVREVLAHGEDGAGAGAAGAGRATKAGGGGRKLAPRDRETGQSDLAGSASTTAGLSIWEGVSGWLRGRVRGLRRPRPARQSTSIARAMEFLMSVTKRRTICFVVSDFLDEGFEHALVTANQRHDVIAVLVTDPQELSLAGVGLVSLRDAETGRTRLYDTGSAAFREAIAKSSAERVRGLEHRMRSAGIDFIHIDAAGSVVDPLVRFFRMRERRSRR
jgi:uncharacterized protein (DUF58 family)